MGFLHHRLVGCSSSFLRGPKPRVLQLPTAALGPRQSISRGIFALPTLCLAVTRAHTLKGQGDLSGPCDHPTQPRFTTGYSLRHERHGFSLAFGDLRDTDCGHVDPPLQQAWSLYRAGTGRIREL